MRTARTGAVRWREFGAGAAAGCAATIVVFLLRLVTGVPTPDEALTEWIVGRLPFPVFAWLLGMFQHAAKPLGFGLTVVLTLVGCGAGGLAFGWALRAPRRPRRFPPVAAAVATAVVLAGVLVLFLRAAGSGATLAAGLVAPTLPLAVAGVVYGLLLTRWIPRTASAGAREVVGRPGGSPAAAPLARRRLARRSVLLAAALGCAVWVVRWVAEAPSGTRRLASEVTPNDQFYQVSKNYPFDPTVDRATWSLEVAGLVATPIRLSYAEFVRAAPAVERYHTLECISNEVGGDLIGNAKWKGVRVRDLLALAGVRPSATTVVWRSADGYRESVPLAIAMDPDSLLVYEMNGVALPEKHGAPLRVLLPNRYGMKQPKWLTGIELSRLDIMGYWERQGLSKAGIVKTQSAFLDAAPGAGAVVALAGWAFAGRRGIARVEISADGGTSWIPASVKAPLGAGCWQWWTAAWHAPAPGAYVLTVRAADAAGVLQPGTFRRLPDGAEGHATVRVRVPG